MAVGNLVFICGVEPQEKGARSCVAGRYAADCRIMLESFLESRRLNVVSAATVRYRLACWLRFSPGLPESVDDVEAFRSAAKLAGLSPRTIESTIFRVLDVRQHLGKRIDPGRKLPLPPLHPDVPTLVQIGLLFSAADKATWPRRLGAQDRANWWRAWICVAAWTAARLSDLESLTWNQIASGGIMITAAKTGKSICVPAPPWLRAHLAPLRGMFGDRVFGVRMARSIRLELARLAESKKVRYVSPQGFRRFGVQSWSAADGQAGAIIHGTGVRGVLCFYLDPSRHLMKYAPYVEIPHEFAPHRHAGPDIAAMIDRAPPAKRKLLEDLCRELL